MRSSLKRDRLRAMLVLAVCSAMLAALATFAPVVAAAPRFATPARAPGAAAVTETTKVTLPETSITGPGFDSFNVDFTVHQTSIAWTGTDAAHHLNVRVGSDGVSFPDKMTLPETSPFGPAFAVGPSDTTPSAALAWTGTDANHSLNVQTFPDGTKLTLHETSFAAPALVFGSAPSGGGLGLLLAWTGTDANHSLNVLPLTILGVGGPTSLVPGTKMVLSQFSSNAGPSLRGATETTNRLIVLGWSTRASQQLNLATSTDGMHFTSALGSGSPQTSATAPQFLQTSGTSSGGCIAWTGTDAAHHLNVQCATQLPQFLDPAHPKTVLPETALGAPGFAGSEIAWTGTDSAHHLNVAQLALP